VVDEIMSEKDLRESDLLAFEIELEPRPPARYVRVQQGERRLCL